MPDDSAFKLVVLKKDKSIKRTGTFIASTVEPKRKEIDPRDPGKDAHLSVLEKEVLTISATTDSLKNLLNAHGSFVYRFQNTDMLDTTIYLTLVADSSTATEFLARVRNIRKREWELYRILISTRGPGARHYAMYIRFQEDLLSLDLPDKSNRENIQIKSISPAIPVIHLGRIDYSQYKIGPGISFNVGLIPTRPLMRLAADIIGPVSVEWMFHPISGFNDVLAIRSSAVGLFFNSAYGLFHWGLAWYSLTYCRAEAYIGINFVPLMQLLDSRKKMRYRW